MEYLFSCPESTPQKWVWGNDEKSKGDDK